MSDLDRLIDEGLNRYGSGDLDGALEAWEEALALDPDNAQANSYVDYVRQNYDVLATDAGVAISDTPFAIEAEPEYTIEIVEGEVGPAPGVATYENFEDAWFIDDDDPLTVHVGRAPSRDAPGKSPNGEKPRTIELEADEPPPLGGVSFDDTTREYFNQKPPRDETIDEFGSEPSSFRAESTPLGFGTQETEIRQRNTGFVQPVPRPPVPSPGGEPPTNTAELRVRVRTPSNTPSTIEPAEPPHGNGSPTPPVTPRSLELEPLELLELAPVISATDPLARSTPPIDEAELARIPTRELPTPRRPGAAGSEISLPADLASDLERTVAGPAARSLIGGDDPVIGVPTQDLGLRPPTIKRPASVYPDEDAKTTQSDARQIRREAAVADQLDLHRADTRRDMTAHLEPGDIDARNTLILAELDEGAAAHEPKDDRLRRRISGLIARAAEWNAAGELDRAVTAVDLALSEDPTSALAQKLVHRNRDAIMSVFQAFLGDLERQPQLTKPLHELAQSPIGSRAAFLLSRIDGMLSIDEILDVSGMPRLEAYRYLCQLFLRGILR